MARNRYTAQQVADAIHESGGFLSAAARRIGCSYATIRNYVNRYSLCQEAVSDAREQMLDKAEGKLYQLIAKGNVTAIIFYLKTQAKHRGYVERQELTGRGGEEVVIRVEYGDGGGHSQAT